MILHGRTYDPCCAWVLGLSYGQWPTNSLGYTSRLTYLKHVDVPAILRFENESAASEREKMARLQQQELISRGNITRLSLKLNQNDAI